MKQKNDYEKWYESILHAVPSDEAALSPWYQLVSYHMVNLKDKCVIEVACGKGEISAFLHNNSKFLVSADISFTACKYLRNKLIRQNIIPNIVVCNIHHLPFKKMIFDVVISCETMEHINYLDKGVSELIRVAKKGTFFYITTPNYFNFFGILRLYLWLRGRQFNSSGTPQPIERVFFFFSITQLFKKYGVKIIKTDGMGFYPLLLPKIQPGKLKIKFIDEIYYLRQLLKPFALHRLVIAKKI